MDNLSHTLVGTLVGEALSRVLPRSSSGLEESQRRNLFVTLMAVGSNLPDADFIYPAITGSKLDYLLHHRGHTHTVLGALIAAALMFAACRAWLRWRRSTPARSDSLQLAAVALLATLLHIAMDATNSYGVHPFWPLHNDWWYGDAVFIVEPLFWAATTPLVFLCRTLFARVLVGLAVIAGVVLSFGTGLVPLPMAVVLALVIAALATLTRLAGPRTAVLAGVAVWLATTAIFMTSHRIAERRSGELMAEYFPEDTTLDQVLTPMPVNPLCWELIAVQESGDRYSLRRAMLSLSPSWLTATECPGRALSAPTTAPLIDVDRASTPALHWHGELTMSRSDVRRLTQEHCEAAAFMHFARALWVAQLDGRWLVGDLRYDREPALSFAELALDGSEAPCPSHVPPWTPPRRDVQAN